MVSCRQKHFLPETTGNSCLEILLNRWNQLRPQLNLFYIRLEQSWTSSNDKTILGISPRITLYLCCSSAFLCLQHLCLCVCGLFTEGRKVWTYGKVNTAKVLLWQKKLTASVLSLFETEPRTREAIKERLKLGGRGDTFLNMHVLKNAYRKGKKTGRIRHFLLALSHTGLG